MATPAKVQIFQGQEGWYWRAKAANGEIVAVGAEPFADKGNAIDAATELWPGVEVEEDDAR